MDTQHQNSRMVHRIYTGGTLCAIFCILGITCLLFVHWIIGAALLLIGIGVSNNYREVSTCSECGNEVANTSRRCPHCQSHFTGVLETYKNNGILYAALGSLTVALIIGVAMWWLIHQANR